MRDLLANFPEYGAGGDYAGSRRDRRSFRLCVTACVLFTAMLWFSERYLRYDHAERLYLSALTLEPESGRVMLRMAVRTDEEKSSNPAPRYLEALAEREEEEATLDTYARAYKLAPKNASLAIRYGCRLYQLGQPEKAREVFAQAAQLAPHNALPAYLEAAVIPWDEGEEAIGQAIMLVGTSNHTRDEVAFPRPLWFPDLPTDGMWYARLRRQVVDECAAPLYRFVSETIEVSEKQLAKGHVAYWDTWLETLQAMGRRLATANGAGTLQATAGLQIELDAIRQRIKFRQRTGSAPDSELIEMQLRVESALNRIQDLENTRHEDIAKDRTKYVYPLGLVWRTLFVFVLVYLLCYIATRFMPRADAPWTLPHTNWGRIVLVGGATLLLLLLCAMAAVQQLPGPRDGALTALGYSWWAVTFVLLGFGLAYPRLALVPPQSAAINADRRRLAPAAGPEEAEADQAPPDFLGAGPMDDTLRDARKIHILAYAVFLRRYFGLTCGLTLVVVSLWTIGYRAFLTFYPWQVRLLTTGLSGPEQAAVREALRILHGA